MESSTTESSTSQQAADASPLSPTEPKSTDQDLNGRPEQPNESIANGSRHEGGVEVAAYQPSDAPIARYVAKFSDRAIQRLVGGNAFLRGRQYARRGHVHDLVASDREASAQVRVKADTHIAPTVRLGGEDQLESQCECPAWRGPTGHCKHVAALLVALRDRERPPSREEYPAYGRCQY